ncbi:MAG TPA: GNAT family N-acetyltransferase [Acidimicrobiales bacterium]|nr:GNAT family N-acetyltransferase [Acidimicrobiales bacterium]
MLLRDLTREDLPFLREMLYAAAAWNPDREYPPVEVALEHPSLRVFHADWGRAGDVGVVAEENGQRVGAACYRLFTAEEHGEGYIDEQTPELGVAVVHEHRGRGIGTALLEALRERAQAAGISRLGLSVEPENPARRLYERLGYVELQPDDDEGRMVLNLR